jgi:hypothetical protein
MPPTPASTLDAARDRLYGIAPDEFVAVRSQLVKELRAHGDAELAAQVARLRRPSVAAWSVNQAARTDPSRVTRLFAAGEGLGRATGGQAIRDAGRRRRDLVDELTDTALRFAATLSPNPEIHRDAIDATWESASIDEAVQPIVAAGWLEKELPRPSGFGLGAAGAAASGTRAPPTRAPASRRTRAKAEAPPDELARRRAEATLEATRATRRDAEHDLAEAERAHTAAHHAAEHAARRVTELEHSLTDARTAARAALAAAKEAERRVARARSVQERATRQEEKARHELDRR